MLKLGLVALAACATVPPSRPAPPEPPQQLEDKSMGVAYGAAITGTVAGLGLVAAGRNTGLVGALVLVFAPASGEIYADATAAAALTSVTRLTGMAVVASEIMSTTSCYDEELQMDTSCPTSTRTKYAYGAIIAATVFDLIYTGFAVDKYNERAAASRVQLVPTSNGLAIGGAF